MAVKNVFALPASARAYATAVASSVAESSQIVKKIQYRPNSRVYGDRKSHLHAQYARLLSSNQLLLLVRYDNVKVSMLNKLRRDVLAAGKKVAKTQALLSPSATSSEPELPSVTFLRAGVFTAALRTRFDEATVQRAVKSLRGSYALIHSPSLNPPQLAQLIRVIERAAPPPAHPPAPPPRRGPANPDDLEDAPPKVPQPPSVKLVAGVVEDKFFMTEDLVGISKLPTLQTLHAQIVGLLSAPAAKLSQILGQAAGGSLLRTLQGFEKGLQEEQEGAKPGDASAPPEEKSS